jgi:hypothetical protein
MSFERINPQGHFEPTNCRWATSLQQRFNQQWIVFKDFTRPPVETITVMNERVDEWTNELQETF